MTHFSFALPSKWERQEVKLIHFIHKAHLTKTNSLLQVHYSKKIKIDINKQEIKQSQGKEPITISVTELV